MLGWLAGSWLLAAGCWLRAGCWLLAGWLAGCLAGWLAGWLEARKSLDLSARRPPRQNATQESASRWCLPSWALENHVFCVQDGRHHLEMGFCIAFCLGGGRAVRLEETVARGFEALSLKA